MNGSIFSLSRGFPRPHTDRPGIDLVRDGLRLFLLVTTLALPTAIFADAPLELREIEFAGTSFSYYLVLPEAFNPDVSYPTALVLPAGSQSREMARAAIVGWAEEARRRGWILICPVAPIGGLFFTGGERYIPRLLDHLQQELRFEHGALHLVGISNGGLSAFRVATSYPEDYLSLMAIPGYPLGDDQERLAVLADKPVTLIVGEQDRGWLENSRLTKKRLEAVGATVDLHVIPEQRHFVMRSLAPARLLELLERSRVAIGQRRSSTSDR